MTPPIALATCAALPDLDSDDQLLLPALADAGIAAEVKIWDDPAVDWGTYELVIIRSTWDYTPKRAAYVNWAECVGQVTRLLNPAAIITWNTDKRYLIELEAKGIPVVKTEWLQAGQTTDFETLLARSGWEEIVVKPVISASGKDTFKVTRSNLSDLQASLETLALERDTIVQPFMRSIATTGELSFLFFNGSFSHAVCKKPATGEFRVQEHLGGILCSFTPTPEQLAFAEKVLQSLPMPVLYARVDVLLDANGHLRLSELELTEPSMYLAHDPASPRRFAEAIGQHLAVKPALA